MSGNLARRPITFTATPTEGGTVQYRVDRVGVFTIGFSRGGYPQAPDDELLSVVYGAWDGTGHSFRAGTSGERPRIYGVELDASGTHFTAHEALAHYFGGECAAWWIRAFRKTSAGTRTDVPDGTRDRVAFIVSALTADFVDRQDYAALLHAHRAARAPERAQQHQRQIQWLGEKLRELTAELQVERALLADQLRLLPDEALSA